MTEEERPVDDAPADPAVVAQGDGADRRPRWTLLGTLSACFFPGALTGVHLTGLLFFLNPRLPFEPPILLRGIAFYAALVGCAGLPPLLLWAQGRRRRAWRELPTWLTCSLLVAAVGYWGHAYHFGYFLPPGINRRLIKAAISLSVAALVCFYTIVLHRVRRRPYGAKSRTLFAAMALLSIYVVVERREAFRPEPPANPRPTTVSSAGRPLLVVVGLEAATFDAILPLAEQGRLPFFAQSLDEGAYGRLSTLEPSRTVPLWTTLATGLLPYRHGIVADLAFEPPFLTDAGLGPEDRELDLLPAGVAFRRWGVWDTGRPIGRESLHGLPVWEILGRVGLSTAVVGWPATTPPASDVRFVLTERFFAESVPTDDDVAPSSLAQRARLFETRPEDLEPSTLARFGSEPESDVVESLCGDLWRLDLAFFLLDGEPLDGLFLRLPGLGAVSAAHFGGFDAVHFHGSDEADAAHSARLLSAYYGEIDASLSRLWDSLPEPKLLVVTSVHGVGPLHGLDEMKRIALRRPAARGSFDAGPDGILLLRGAGIRPGVSLERSALVDPLPTLLYGVGLPVARDLDGTVLTEAFDPAFLARQPLEFVPSYLTFAARDTETPGSDGP